MKLIVALVTLFFLCQGNNWLNNIDADGCSKGTIRHIDRCYYINDNYDTFYGANKYCRDRKSQLATGLTREAHKNLVKVLKFHRSKCPRGQNCDEFWMGIKDITKTNWKTGNNFIIERTREYQKWAEGYPRGPGTCGIMSLKVILMRGAWKTENCTEKFKSVCITCPNDYEYIPHLDECFYLNLNVANWSEAQKNCAKTKKGAHLMTIRDSTKQAAVERFVDLQLGGSGGTHICFDKDWFLAGRIMYMGGQTTVPDVCNTPYVWKQLSAPYIPFTYTNWLPYTPNCNQAGENCLILTTSKEYNFRWEDIGCYYKLCSLCEF